MARCAIGACTDVFELGQLRCAAVSLTGKIWDCTAQATSGLAPSPDPDIKKRKKRVERGRRVRWC